MREILSTPERGAISAGGTSAVGKSPDGRFAIDDEHWFSEMAQDLLPTKPGTALHFITAYDERLCQRYAAGSVKPSAYFLRRLLRSDHGATFLAALMDGSQAKWWTDHLRAERVAAQIRNLDLT